MTKTNEQGSTESDIGKLYQGEVNKFTENVACEMCGVLPCYWLQHRGDITLHFNIKSTDSAAPSMPNYIARKNAYHRIRLPLHGILGAHNRV